MTAMVGKRQHQINMPRPAAYDEHMIFYEHLLAKASIQHLLENLEADSKSRQLQAVTDFHSIDAADQDPNYQESKTRCLHAMYAVGAAA